MILTRTAGGEYHALYRYTDGSICFGYGRTAKEAIGFCLELIAGKEAQHGAP